MLFQCHFISVCMVLGSVTVPLHIAILTKIFYFPKDVGGKDNS